MKTKQMLLFARILVDLNHRDVAPHSVSRSVRSPHYVTDFSRQFMLLRTEVGGETEVADTALEVPTPSGLLCLSYQTQVPQRLPNQFVLVNSFAVKLFL